MTYPKVKLVNPKKKKVETDVVEIDKNLLVKVDNIHDFVQIRDGGCLSVKGLYIDDSEHDWHLVTDDEGALVLVPTKKLE